jgi:hypothetical protein
MQSDAIIVGHTATHELAAVGAVNVSTSRLGTVVERVIPRVACVT